MSMAVLSKPADAQTVSGVVSLESCTAPAQTVTFSFSSATKSYFFTRTVTLNSDGSYAQPGLPADLYHVKVKGAKWLAAVSDVDTRQGNATLSPSLLTGDANNDNSVDSTDFGLVIEAFGGDINLPNSGYDPACDLDCDGLVDSSDFGLLIGDYGTVGDDLPVGTARPLSNVTYCNALDFAPDPNNSCCLDYYSAVSEEYFNLSNEEAFVYASAAPETMRFEGDFTPTSMQTHLVLATRNGAHVCIYNAPTIIQPAAVLTAPGTVLYDATFAPAAPGTNQNDPMQGVINSMRALNVALTAGTIYHLVIEYNSANSFETTPVYANSYGLVPAKGLGSNGATLFAVCADPVSNPKPPDGSANPITVDVKVGGTDYGAITVTLVNGRLDATFKTKDGLSLTAMEMMLGQDHLNWLQIFTHDDDPLHNRQKNLCKTPYIDPAAEGYSDPGQFAHDDYPWYLRPLA